MQLNFVCFVKLMRPINEFDSAIIANCKSEGFELVLSLLISFGELQAH